jgi:hypothetical protein
MTRPGVEVQVQTSPPPRSAPTDAGIAFIVGLCDQGPTGPILVQSLDDFTKNCGARVTYSVLWDAVDCYFREGGHEAFISRVVGPAAAIASLTLATNALVAKALGPGAYGNNISVAVLAPLAAGYRVQVLYSGTIVETSPDLVTQQDGVNWATTASNYITLTLGAGTNPPIVAAAAPLVGGADDRNNITDTQWANALALFSPDLGPGQVLAPGRTSDLGHTQLCDHAKNNGRVAILDLPDVSAKGTLEASANAARGTGNGQYAACFTPWLQVPGVIQGIPRVVPPSGSIAGIIGRVDASDNPNVPAAGDKGVLRYCLGFTQPAWSGPDRQELNGAGVDVIIGKYGGFRVYGYRSLADPVNNKSWLDFSNSRYLMWLAARCQQVGEAFVFAPIDGQGYTISEYGATLSGICQADWNAGIIFGLTSQDAFNVDVGSSVNTPDTIADNQLRAVVAVRPDPFAELVTILIVNVPVTQAVA